MTEQQPITDARLAEIEERIKDLPHGPWQLIEGDAHFMNVCAADETYLMSSCRMVMCSSQEIADSIVDKRERAVKFAVTSRQDVPDLVAEVRRLRCLLDAKSATDYVELIRDHRSDPETLPPLPIWDDATVFALNANQHNNTIHPYTCGNDSGHRPLIATPHGWKCADCDYTQEWAWDASKKIFPAVTIKRSELKSEAAK